MLWLGVQFIFISFSGPRLVHVLPEDVIGYASRATIWYKMIKYEMIIISIL